jgi:uncharacterized membrane protein
MFDGPLFRGCIVRFSRRICLYRVVRMIVYLGILIVCIPLLSGSLVGQSVSAGFSLVLATILLQAAAAIVGLGLGLHPLLILLITTSVAAGCIYGIYESCELFAVSSPRITRWLRNVEERTKNVTYLSRYGALMLIPIIWIPGISLYGSPLVAWLFRWNRNLSFLCMIIGWMIAVIVVMATALGLFRLFF